MRHADAPAFVPLSELVGRSPTSFSGCFGQLFDNVNIKVYDPCHLDFFQVGPVIIMSTMQPSDGFCYSGPTYRHIDDPPFSNYIP
jgi:hypothetical protein